jgi:prepilin signal peptidase PulO-like enzyme (type II secretory pathway)
MSHSIEIAFGLIAGLAMLVTIYRTPLQLQVALWFDACRACRRFWEWVRCT